MSKNPMVSVLMTAYNREQYIATAIESVLNSTWKDFELVITDDGSTDSTISIVRSYCEQDSRVKLSVNKVNLGDYPNRNEAARLANGKYLKYVDADDYIYPWGLEIMVEMMENCQGAGWGLCSLEQNVARPFPISLAPKEAYYYNYFGPGLFHKAPLSSIIRRDVFEEIGGFKPIRMAGDFDMWHRLAKKWPVVLMPQGIVWYREHEEQEMNHYERFASTYERLKIDHLKDDATPLSLQERKRIMTIEKNRVFKRLVKSLFKFRLSDVNTNLKRIKEYYV